jgi:hypothetical protein
MTGKNNDDKKVLTIIIHWDEHNIFSSLRYGFVTFAQASVAYEVLDKFMKDPSLSEYDLRFGGRRKFCKQNYADLDSLPQDDVEMSNINNINHNSNIKSSSSTTTKSKTSELSFEDLLNMTKRKLCKK